MSTLNPRQFFHGTARKFSPGDVLLPASQTGNRIHSPSAVAEGPDGDASRVFSTTDERDAWTFAESAGRGGSRPYVYEVRPVGGVEGNYQEGMLHSQWETTSDQAEVLRRIDVPPPHTEFFDATSTGVAVQPTFPGDDPAFAHGFMREGEATRNLDRYRFDQGYTLRDNPDRARMSATLAERGYRKRQAEAADAGRTHQPEMFATANYSDGGAYLEEKRYRTRW